MDEQKEKAAEAYTDTEVLKEVLRYDELWCEIIAQYGEWAKKQGISRILRFFAGSISILNLGRGSRKYVLGK